MVIRRANRYRAPDRVAPDRHGYHHNGHNRRSSAVECETPHEAAAIHRIADQRTLGQAAPQHSADRTSTSDTDPERSSR